MEKKFREDVFQDFQAETLRDHDTGSLYGLEKFWAFLKYYKVSHSVSLVDLVQLVCIVKVCHVILVSRLSFRRERKRLPLTRS